MTADAAPVRGRSIPAPRPTVWAGVVLVARYGLPLVVTGFVIDLALWLAR